MATSECNHIGILVVNQTNKKFNGKYGVTFQSKYKSVDVQVVQVLKRKFRVQKNVLEMCQGHPNIITYHAVLEKTLYK